MSTPHLLISIALFTNFAIASAKPPGSRPNDLGKSPLPLGEPGIAWYPRLEDGIAEAKRTNRPILFMAAASQCRGVPGIF